jgi:hypothetical protein
LLLLHAQAGLNPGCGFWVAFERKASGIADGDAKELGAVNPVKQFHR